MTRTKEVFDAYHVDYSGESDTTQSLQTAISDLLHDGYNIEFPEGHYLVSDTILFDQTRPGRRLRISGWGATIEAWRGWNTEIDVEEYTNHHPENGKREFEDIRTAHRKAMFEVERGENEWQFLFEGFTLDGSGLLGLTALDVHGMTQSEVSNCTFRNSWYGLRLSGWNNRILNCVGSGGYVPFWIGIGDAGSGCKVGSNMNEIMNCRVFGSKSAWNNHQILPYSHYVIEGGGCKMDMCTSEGKMYRYQVVANTAGNCMYGLKLGHVHTETQEWGEINRQTARSLGIVEQRHTLEIDGWSPRWGVRSFSQGRGNIIQRNITVSDAHLPRAWENIDRMTAVYATAEHGAWTHGESYDKYREALGVDGLTMVVNGRNQNNL